MRQEAGEIVDGLLRSREHRGTCFFERDRPPRLTERDDESSFGDESIESWSGDEDDNEPGDLPRMFDSEEIPKRLLDGGDGRMTARRRLRGDGRW